MWHIGRFAGRNCDGMSRRHLLQIGGLGLLGLGLPHLLRGPEKSKASGELSCIFLWLDGGPSHLETFDPKPATPDTVRGPYGTIQTNVTGIQIGELLPQLAERADKYALVRSMNHRIDAHAPVPVMTGFQGANTSHGAVVTKFKGAI